MLSTDTVLPTHFPINLHVRVQVYLWRYIVIKNCKNGNKTTVNLLETGRVKIQLRHSSRELRGSLTICDTKTAIQQCAISTQGAVHASPRHLVMLHAKKPLTRVKSVVTPREGRLQVSSHAGTHNTYAQKSPLITSCHSTAFGCTSGHKSAVPSATNKTRHSECMAFLYIQCRAMVRRLT